MMLSFFPGLNIDVFYVVNKINRSYGYFLPLSLLTFFYPMLLFVFLLVVDKRAEKRCRFS